jgi:hypothetical protein
MHIHIIGLLTMHNVLLKPVLASTLSASDFYADLKVGKVRKIQAISQSNDKIVLDFAKGRSVTLKASDFVCILHAIRRA